MYLEDITMFKRILAALCCLALIFAVGCGKGVVYDDLSTYESENNEQADNSQKTVNPLTGESNVTAEVASRRPVALMVNNISVAQEWRRSWNLILSSPWCRSRTAK